VKSECHGVDDCGWALCPPHLEAGTFVEQEYSRVQLNNSVTWYSSHLYRLTIFLDQGNDGGARGGNIPINVAGRGRPIQF